MEGQYGQEDIFISTPCIIGKNGVEEVLELSLNDEERQELNDSCNTIREHIALIK